MIRQPIVTILGHVDHGKTSILDRIRGSGVARFEAGGITQAIGASILPLATIKAICGKLLDALKFTVSIPGLLFIDTPGHAAFTNLRRRGGNLADLSILVVDINEGFMPQTEESIQILKNYKTPFVVAANKLDLIDHWKTRLEGPLAKSITDQDATCIRSFETKLYELVAKLESMGIHSERFDRVDDFAKQVAIVPLSAKTGEGIPELLLMLMGLSQKYLSTELQIEETGQAKGTVLEVKEEKGLGKVMDVIIYDGTLHTGDTIVIGGIEQPVVAKIKTLLVPAPLAEMRERKTRFQRVTTVIAATGVRICVANPEDIIAGVPLLSVRNSTTDANSFSKELEAAKKAVQQEVEEVIILNGTEGVIIKADTLGSLEALTKLLKDSNIPVKRSSVGNITKKDITDATANPKPHHKVILGFNVSQSSSSSNDSLVSSVSEPGTIHIITSDVIYRLIEQYTSWVESQKESADMEQFNLLTKPAKIQLLNGYVFRQSNPAVVGIEVMAGTLAPKVELMNPQGKILTVVKDIQAEQEHITEAKRGSRVSVSLPNVIVGRQINEGDIFYTAVPEEHFRKLKSYKQLLSPDAKEVLREIAEIMRKTQPVWGL